MPQTSDPLQSKRVELVLQQLEQLPTLPAIALRILELTGDADASFADVISLIESDVSLTARILSLVRRADLGVRGEVTTVERAVKLLGFDAVRHATLAISVFETLGGESAKAGPNFSREQFWKHSVAVACCAELIALQVKSDRKSEGALEPSEAFVCGLLHDLGKVALDAILPKSFSRVIEAANLLRGNIADLERTVIGLDHMVVGKRLAERWQLPATLRDTIWLHGQVPSALPPGVRNARMVNLITLADQLVREQHLGYSGNYSFTIPRQVLCDAVGVTSEQLAGVMQNLVEHMEPRAAALRLGQSTTSELYQQALSQANQELGRVSGQLAAKNKRLAMRAKFFDALAEFQSELHADAPPSMVLQAIGQTAVTALDVRSVAVFSLVPANRYADVMLLNDQGEIITSSIISCPSRPQRPETGDGPVLSAGDELEWLLNDISPRLPHDHRFWMCLEADGACVGGIVWGGATGESQRLSPQAQELTALATGWGLALRTSQIRDEARQLAEQLAEVNRQLQSAQSEVLRSRMMISVGEMAAGAAHEMNNPLAVISGRSQLLASTLSDPRDKAAARLIFEQSQRLSDIITELMHVAQPRPPTPVVCDLAGLVDAALAQAKTNNDPADRQVEVTFSEVPMVRVDAEQVTQAVVEVLDNAWQATVAPNGSIGLHAAFDPYSSRVVLTISDTGCGMDERTVKRAFDPFFSSKPAGRRRGMGLAKALRWVEGSGGSIRLESQVGVGTRVLILLPAAVEPNATEAVL